MMSAPAPEYSPLDRPLQITVWRSQAPREAHGGKTTLRQMAVKIAERHAPRKDQLYWLKLATFGNVYSPKGYLRHNENVVSVSGLEADYDGGDYGVDWAVQQAERSQLACLIYTSPSHTVDAPRWRVLAPFSEDLSPDMRRAMMGRLNGAFGGIFAGESWTLSQSYYYGYVDGNQDAHRVELVDGEAIDLLHDLDKIWMDKPNTKPRYESDGPEDGAPIDLAELDVDAALAAIREGASFHPTIRALAAKFIGEGKPRHEVYRLLTEAGAQVPTEMRDRRWHDRFSPYHLNSILDWVIGQEKKKLFTLYYEGDYVDPPPPRAEAERAEGAKQKEEKATGPSGRLLLTAAEFVNGFTPPSYLIDGIVQRGYLYSLTARTGHGKTAVNMHVGQCVARGAALHNRRCKPGAVLFCAGENPDDIRARYIVLAERCGFTPASVPFHFINGVVDIEKSFARIRQEAETIADLMLVIVDTAAAYFPGDDPNNNAQQVAYARILRKLTTDLPTKPAVIVNCHPIKNAAKDNLIPMGGSAFLNEVDGNLTLWKGTDSTTEMHWQGKFRGPEFEPLMFSLETVTSDVVVDDAGRHMPSVIARPIGELEIQTTEAAAETDENVVLAIIANNRPLSMAAIAMKADWRADNGAPLKAKVQRVIARLAADKLVQKARGGKYKATREGRRELGLDDE